METVKRHYRVTVDNRTFFRTSGWTIERLLAWVKRRFPDAQSWEVNNIDDDDAVAILRGAQQ